MYYNFTFKFGGFWFCCVCVLLCVCCVVAIVDAIVCCTILVSKLFPAVDAKKVSKILVILVLDAVD